MVNGLVTWLGHLTLDQITPRVIEQHMAARLKGGLSKPSPTKTQSTVKAASKTTANRDLRTLKAMFSKAHDWGYVFAEVRDKIHSIKLLREGSSRERYLSPDELSSLLAICRQEDVQLWRMATIAANTGLRLREMLRMRWDRHVDLDNRILTVTADLAKSAKPRSVPINAACLEALMADNKSSWVFPGPFDSHALNYSRKKWKRALARAGIEDFRFHDLRHTFATNFLFVGGNVRLLQGALGHASLKTTNRYSHLNVSLTAETVDQLYKTSQSVPVACRKSPTRQTIEMSPMWDKNCPKCESDDINVTAEAGNLHEVVDYQELQCVECGCVWSHRMRVFG